MISSSTFLFFCFSTFVACCVLFVSGWPKIKNMSKWYTLGAVFLPLLSCVIFWSMALHMHTHFNGWPRQIGYQDFSVALEQHAKIQEYILTLTFGVAFMAAPLLTLIFSLTPKLRPLLDYLRVFYLAFSLLALSLFAGIAPKGYLDWFWD